MDRLWLRHVSGMGVKVFSCRSAVLKGVLLILLFALFTLITLRNRPTDWRLLGGRILGWRDSRWKNVGIHPKHKANEIFTPEGNSRVVTISAGSPFFGKIMEPEEEIIQTSSGNICQFVNSYSNSDAVMFHGPEVLIPNYVGMPRRKGQIWIFVSQEAPVNVRIPISTYEDTFNLTMSYHTRLSDIAMPYGKRINLTVEEHKKGADSPSINYAYGKTKLGVTRISQCLPSLMENSNRLQYLHQLKLHMNVDFFGSCLQGIRCGADCSNAELGRQYKFFFAFENSLCEDYITEKMWHVSFNFNMVPVVMGGLSRQDYEKVAPPHSYIYGDDFAGPKELAKYLIMLDSNDDEYNRYFEWKKGYRVVPTASDLSALEDETISSLCNKVHGLRRKGRPQMVNLAEQYSRKQCRIPTILLQQNHGEDSVQPVK